MLPKKIRKDLGNTEIFYLLMGKDGEIWGIDSVNWVRLTEEVLQTPLSTREGRDQRRKFFSFAEECFLDNQGRFILPSEFADRLGNGDEILIIGAGDHFELWDPNKWIQIEQ